MNFLIVGSGLSGATIARLAAEDGHNVKVIDKRDHIGGNVYDYMDEETGIRLSKYGAHIFHTNDEVVWEFVNRFSSWDRYEHRVLSRVGGVDVPVPVNRTTINTIFNMDLQSPEAVKEFMDTITMASDIKNSEDSAISRVGNRLYELMFKNYTIKQWAIEPKDLDASVMDRIPIRYDDEDRYFTDKYQAMPTNGYTAFMESLLDHKNIEVELGREFDKSKDINYDRVYFTGKIDGYFNEELGKLQYRSLEFKYETVDVDNYQPTSVVNYPGLEYEFTRIVDYKKFYNSESKKSIIAKEYSTSKGEPYYPIPTEENKSLYERYKEKAQQEETGNVKFVGRLANYKYFNMDQAIRNAIDKYKESIK